MYRGRGLVYGVFLLSGAAGLTYQIIWARWLGLVFGGTTASISIVLASFMAGLAFGSFAVGRLLPRVTHPLRLYGWAELGIGAFAIAFPLVTAACDAIFVAAVQVESPLAWSFGIRIVLALLLLLVPTTLMGATLPLLTEHFKRGPEGGGGWRVGYLYGINTFGAAVGTLLASLVGIELLGVRGTSWVAAAINLAVGVWALRAGRDASATPEVEAEPPIAATAASIEARVAMVVLALSGGIALGSEVLWTRALESLIGSSTYAFALLLVVYLVGIAAGSWTTALRVKRLASPIDWLVGTQLALAALMALAVAYFHALAAPLRELGEVSVPATFLLEIYARAGLILLPLALLSGATFTLATRVLEPGASDAGGALVARAYAWNTVGAVAGSFLAGFVIAPAFDYFQAIYALAVAYALSALGAAAVLALHRVRPVRRAGAFGVVALLFVLWGAPHVTDESRFAKRMREAFPDFELAFHESGIQGVTSVVHRKGRPRESALLVNGTGMTRQLTLTKMMAHIPMLVHEDAEDVLVICFGMGTTYRSAVSHGANVTVVELVGEVVDAFGEFFDDAEELREKGRIVVNDGRNFLKLTRERFDVITVDPPPPIDAAGVNNLYSLEFIELARSRLKPGGIFAHWIPLPGTLSGVYDDETFDMLEATMEAVFPHVATVVGRPLVGVHVLGSMTPFVFEESLMHERAAAPSVAADLNEWGGPEPGYLSVPVLHDRSRPTGAPLVTDDRPRLEFDLIRLLRSGGKKPVHLVWW
jgi:spermidine synthase